MVIGYVFVVLVIAEIIVFRFLRFTKIRPSLTVILISAIVFIVGVALAGIGDHYRVSMSKDMVLSYYEKNIPYEKLTTAQQKNITCATVELMNATRNGQDISRYRPAMEKYLTEEAIVGLRYSPEKAEEHAKSLMSDK